MPVNTRIQLRRGTAAAGANQWVDQVLAAGEVGFESDSGKFKIGDGTTAWNSLDYASVLPSELNELVDDRVANLLVAGSNISLTYDDSANTLTIATDGLDNEQVEDIIGTKLAGGDGISVSYNDSTGVTTVSLSDPTIQLSDITDLSSNARTFLLTPSSANLATLVSDETGTGALVFATNPTLQDGMTFSTTSSIPAVISSPEGFDIQTDVGNTISLVGSVDLGNPGADNYTVNLSTNWSINGTAVTSTANELNLLDGSVADTVVNSKAVIYGSSGQIAASSLETTGNVTVGGDLTVNGTQGSTSATTGALVVDGGVGIGEKLYVSGYSSFLSGAAFSNDLASIDGSGNLNAVSLGVGGNQAISSANNLTVVNGDFSGTLDVTGATTLSANLDVGGTLNVSGDLIVGGSTTTVNSTVVTVDDPVFTLGGDTAPTVDDNKDRGIEFRYYSGSAKIGFFGYDDSTGKFTFIPDATNTGEVFSGTKGELDANVDWSNILNKPDPTVTVTLTGDVTGTANATLTDLASGTITVATTVTANSVALGTDTTGDYVADVTVSGTGLSVTGTGEGASVVVTSNATSANTANTIVSRDGSGNFSAGTITANLTGTASTATNANNIEVDTSSSNVNHLVFVNGTDGNLKPNVNSNLRFDAVNNELLGDDSTTPTTALKYFVIDGGTP